MNKLVSVVALMALGCSNVANVPYDVCRKGVTQVNPREFFSDVQIYDDCLQWEFPRECLYGKLGFANRYDNGAIQDFCGTEYFTVYETGNKNVVMSIKCGDEE
jgi:hypothetical protein